MDGARSSRLYRLRLVPARGDGAGRARVSWDILGPTLVEDGYELYWNGQRLGGSGRLGPEAPRVVGTRPLRFALPADAAGTRGVLAVRAFMLPRSAPSADGGGMHSAPILAPRPISDALHRVQWERTIAGYIVEVIEPMAMLAVIGLAVGYRSRSSHKSFLILASIALALMAARRLNNAIVAWTDLMDLTTYAWLASVMWVPVVAAWTLAWNRWCLRPRPVHLSQGEREDYRRTIRGRSDTPSAATAARSRAGSSSRIPVRPDLLELLGSNRGPSPRAVLVEGRAQRLRHLFLVHLLKVGALEHGDELAVLEQAHRRGGGRIPGHVAARLLDGVAVHAGEHGDRPIGDNAVLEREHRAGARLARRAAAARSRR